MPGGFFYICSTAIKLFDNCVNLLRYLILNIRVINLFKNIY